MPLLRIITCIFSLACFFRVLRFKRHLMHFCTCKTIMKYIYKFSMTEYDEKHSPRHDSCGAAHKKRPGRQNEKQNWYVRNIRKNLEFFYSICSERKRTRGKKAILFWPNSFSVADRSCFLQIGLYNKHVRIDNLHKSNERNEKRITVVDIIKVTESHKKADPKLTEFDVRLMNSLDSKLLLLYVPLPPQKTRMKSLVTSHMLARWNRGGGFFPPNYMIFLFWHFLSASLTTVVNWYRIKW